MSTLQDRHQFVSVRNGMSNETLRTTTYPFRIGTAEAPDPLSDSHCASSELNFSCEVRMGSSESVAITSEPIKLKCMKKKKTLQSVKLLFIT